MLHVPITQRAMHVQMESLRISIAVLLNAYPAFMATPPLANAKVCTQYNLVVQATGLLARLMFIFRFSLACINDCLACTSYSTCTACTNSTFAFSDSCIPTCPSAFYGDGVNGQCKGMYFTHQLVHAILVNKSLSCL